MAPALPTDDLEQAPDEQAEAPAENPYGEDFRDLPEEIVNVFRAHIAERRGQEKYTRRREVIRDRTNRFYERGYQHIIWNDNKGTFSLAAPNAIVSNSEGQQVQCPTYIDDYNIFHPFQRILTGVLTQNPPGVNFQPIDPKIPEDLDKAETAENYAKAFDRMNDRPMIQADIVRMMALSGRAVSWTRTEEDGQRFGYDEAGNPKKFQRTTIHGTLETKCPITAKELCECGYFFIDDDPDVNQAKTDYDWIADKIKAGQPTPGESSYERTARLGVLNGTRSQAQVGDSFTHLAARSNVFLRPSEFAADCFDEIRDEVKQYFSDGVRLVFIGETYACAHPESMDDHLDVQFPYAGDGMFRQAFMDPMRVVQDSFNDAMNGAREHFDTGWGETWIDAEDEEYDAITSQRSAPNAIRQKKLKHDQAINDAVKSVEMQNLPATFVQFVQMLQSELPQFQLAAPPAIFGAAMEDQKTASGYAQARSQAMGQLGIIWARIQRMFARIRFQSALAAAECEELESINIPGQDGEQSITIDMVKLRKGDFGCYPDEDSSFPESTQQKRATFATVTTLAAQSPQVAAMLDNPDNVALAKRMWGLDELTLVPAEARKKQLFEIEKLLREPPIPASPEEMEAANVQHAAASIAAKASGQPEPPPPDPMAMMQSSVPVDELDFHQFEFEKCQEWLSSSERRAEDAKGNTAGVMNVRLHALEHRKFLAMMAAAAAPPPAPAPAAHAPAKKPPAQAGPTPGPAAPAAAPAV